LNYFFDSERRYNTSIINAVRAKMRRARETVKNRVSRKEYTIDTKETLPTNSIAVIIICLFCDSFISMRYSPFWRTNDYLTAKRSFFSCKNTSELRCILLVHLWHKVIAIKYYSKWVYFLPHHQFLQ
jgi:hypothetical protein